MKKILLAMSIIAGSFAANAQSEAQNVVKINPLGLIFGSANLSYERALSEKSSVVISPSFGFFNSGGYKYSTYGIGGEYRFYLSGSKNAPAGTYLGPGISYAFGKAKMDDVYNTGSEESFTVSGISARAMVGHQWIWNGGITLDLNGGVQYFNLKGSANGDPMFTGFSGVLPSVGLAIGYAF